LRELAFSPALNTLKERVYTMGWIYKKAVRPILFATSAEDAHKNTVASLSLLAHMTLVCRLLEMYSRTSATRPIEVFGLKFPNAVGMAAGMDKNAQFWRAAAAFGFGHVEIGTVTALGQPGNPSPRLFRYPDEEAIINRMGFNNSGAEAIAASLRKAGAHAIRPIPLGINIGKTKVTPLDRAVDDYLQSFNLLADYADYFTINISSPNTPDLRKLQGDAYLPELLRALKDANRARAGRLGTKEIPILVKIAPDLSFPEIDSVLRHIQDNGIDGIVATNTTISRPVELADANETGGLSGKPLFPRSLEIVNYISRATGGKLPIVGVGGICDPTRAAQMMDAGASLVQIYTGWIYNGPFYPAEVAKSLEWRQRPWANA
jgi:dihydroorotate dehydrogenase